MRTLLLPLLVLTLPLAACKRTDTVPVPEPAVAAASTASPASAETASGADDNLNAVLWVQTSTEYQALTTQTYRAAADHLEKALAEVMDLTPRGIRTHLDLNKPIYAKTAAYGHFGRKVGRDGSFSWEKTDLIKALKAAVA